MRVRLLTSLSGPNVDLQHGQEVDSETCGLAPAAIARMIKLGYAEEVVPDKASKTPKAA